MPRDGIVRGSFSLEGWNTLLKERLALGPMSDWEKQIFDTMVEWTVYGVPDTADYLQPATGSHNLSHEELQLSLDKLGKCVVIVNIFPNIFHSLLQQDSLTAALSSVH